MTAACFQDAHVYARLCKASQCQTFFQQAIACSTPEMQLHHMWPAGHVRWGCHGPGDNSVYGKQLRGQSLVGQLKSLIPLRNRVRAPVSGKHAVQWSKHNSGQWALSVLDSAERPTQQREVLEACL